MKFKIEKGIKLPARRKGVMIYPLREMEVGDSIVSEFEYSRKNMSKLSNRLRNFCYKSPDCKGWKFSTRKENDKLRFWRIK